MNTCRELAILNRSTNKLKSVNLFGAEKIGEVSVTWNGNTPTYNKRYFFKDHLGLVRVTTDSSGATLSAKDYYPFGETAREYNNASITNRYQFTEKERDAETNFDYFGANVFPPHPTLSRRRGKTRSKKNI